nr:hypothetical protein [Allomuricauda sp.]
MTKWDILVAITLLVQLGFGIVVLAQKKKLKRAVFLKRKGDTVILEDGDGNVISERIIIKTEK